MSAELRIWREACLDGDLALFLDRVLPELAGRLPVETILVRRTDAESARLETVAGASRRPDALPKRHRTELSPENLRVYKDWTAKDAVHRVPAGARDALTRTLLPQGVESALLAGPLRAHGPADGVVLFLAAATTEFQAEHARFFRELLAPFAAAAEKDRLRHEVERLRESALAERLASGPSFDMNEVIIGSETGLRGVMERVEMVARTDAPVLIQGETGSGKEVVARAIHARSLRSEGPVLRVNCGAIPPDLIDSELFGHERGSFTGAVATRKGWFERSDGGTLFLDEIGELPLPAQVRLLRILQDGSFERVGGQQVLTCDVRLVAATHRDLPGMVRDHRFREDLWYRISVFPVRLPPLRERLEDIPALASHFALRAGSRLGSALPLKPGPRDIEILQAYSWPGNVRELASVIERAAILGHGVRLEVEAALGASPSAPAGGIGLVRDDGPTGVAEPGAGLGARSGRFPTIDEAMAGHIRAALARTSGRIEGTGGAAELLGINPHTLRARMRKLKIDWGRFRART